MDPPQDHDVGHDNTRRPTSRHGHSPSSGNGYDHSSSRAILLTGARRRGEGPGQQPRAWPGGDDASGHRLFRVGTRSTLAGE